MATAPSTTTRLDDAALAEHPIVHVVACGSVDDGKSTLIGRLLADPLSLPRDAYGFGAPGFDGALLLGALAL